MGALYLSEILALALTIIAVIVGLAIAYILIKERRRKWKWEDQVHENAIRKGILEELDIRYEVDTEGFIKPVITRPEIGQKRHS